MTPNPPSNEESPNKAPSNGELPNKAPSNAESPNNEMARLYRETYEKELKKQSQEMQERVLAVKSNIAITDRMVDYFINEVISKAEKEFEELEQSKKLNKNVESGTNPS